MELVFTKVDDYNNMIGTVLNGNDAPDIYVNYSWMYGREQYQSSIDHAEDLADPELGLDLDCIRSNIMLKTDEEVKPISAEAIYSGILGILTGAIMESPSAIYGEAQTASAGRKLKEAGGVDSLAKIGNTFAPDTVAYKLAGKVNENTGAYTIGQLFNEIGASLTEQNVNEIAEALNMEQSTISHQLRILRANKLVRGRRDGKQIYYSLDDDHVKKIIEMGLDHVLE